MKKLLALLLVLITSSTCYAGTANKYLDYDTTSEVNATNLNGNFDNVYNVVNGGLDNENADTDSGFRFLEIVATQPAAGDEGRLIYDKETGDIEYDTGLAWASLVTVGVDIFLSHLGSPTAINSSLLPGTDDSIDLGSGSKQWQDGYFSNTVNADVVNCADVVATANASAPVVDTQYINNSAGGVVTVQDGVAINGAATINGSATISSTLSVGGAISGTNTNWDAAYTHVSSNGSDHSYIDQDVTYNSAPHFQGTNITGYVSSDTLASVVARGYIADGVIAASDVIVTSTASPVTVDTQYINNSVGGPVLIQDDLTVGGTINSIVTSGNIRGETKHIRFVVMNPNVRQAADNEICLIPAIDSNITITRLVVTLDASTNQVAGDIKYADTFIGLANPVVINAFDTSSGVLDDSSITQGAVPSGKCIYLSYDSSPNAAITQQCVDLYFNY